MSKRERDLSQRMNWGQRIAFGFGLGGGGILATMGGAMLVYYTNVIHIDPGLAGTVLALSRILDGFSDLAAGRIVDKTNSRWGKARPWLLWGLIPTLLCMVLAFAVPSTFSTIAKIAYCFITYNLFSTVCYTMITVAYHSMESLVTDNQYERGINSITSMVLYTVALLMINANLLKMTAGFGGGDLYSPTGWTLTALVTGIAFALCTIITFIFCKEMKARAQDAQAVGQPVSVPVKTEQAAPVGKTLKALFRNKYWVQYVLALLTNGLGNGFITGTLLYYCQFILGDANIYSSVSVYLYVAMFLGIIATYAFIKKLGKRNTAIIGLVILAVGTVMAAVFPANQQMLTITIIIRGFGCGFPSALGNAVLQDTLTYGKWKNGFDMVGMGNAACSFTNKVGTGLGTALLGWILAWAGYDGALAVQSDSANAAIRLCHGWIPLIFVIATLICFGVYKLDKEYPRYAKDLAEGRFGPDAEVLK